MLPVTSRLFLSKLIADSRVGDKLVPRELEGLRRAEGGWLAPPCAAGRPGKHHKLFVQRLAVAFEFHSRNTLKNNNLSVIKGGRGINIIATPRSGGSGEASGKVSPGVASIWEQFHELLKFDGSSNFSLGYSRTIAPLSRGPTSNDRFRNMSAIFSRAYESLFFFFFPLFDICVEFFPLCFSFDIYMLWKLIIIRATFFLVLILETVEIQFIWIYLLKILRYDLTG